MSNEGPRRADDARQTRGAREGETVHRSVRSAADRVRGPLVVRPPSPPTVSNISIF